MRTRVGAVAPWIALCLMAGMLTACGGGSSSSTGPSSFSGGGGGGSGATIQGQVRRNGSAALHESAVAVVLRAALGVGIAEAAVGDPVVGFTVNLLSCTSPAIITSTTTDTSGNFQFTGLAAGCYVVQVVELPPGTLVLGTSSQVVVGDGDIGTVVGTARVATETGVPPVVTITSVNVVATNVNDLLQNNAQVCHAISIATAAGVNPLDVIKARQGGGGHGWGQIAHQFGVPPSVLGNQSCTETQVSDTVALAGGGGKGNGKGKGKGKGNNS
jgi:hypothetical protein